MSALPPAENSGNHDRTYYAVAMALGVLALLYPVLDLGLLGLGLWTLAFWALLIALLYASPTLRRRRGLAFGASGTAIVAAAAALACHLSAQADHEWTLTAVNAVLLVHLVLATGALAQRVFGASAATRGVLCGAACVYVLIGITWSYAYHVLHGVGITDALTLAEASADPARRHADFLYFSFVTLSTLGYGDITPSTLVLRVAAASEAITGQVFLTILVARVVGLHLVRQAQSD